MKEEQVTWGGRFSEKPSQLMQRFGESISFDARLAPFDVQGSLAYAKMLCHVGIISESECQSICNGLELILEKIKAGEFSWSIELEDVHMNIEQALTNITPAGAKLHTARSRNEQVAVDMRLFFKASCGEFEQFIKNLQCSLVGFAERNVEVTIPGYTHLQRAQPVLMAHHILAYVEMLERDLLRFKEVAKHANWCPLGSGALAGTTLGIDRDFMATELGFVDEDGKAQVTHNSMDAVADRDTFVEYVTACSLVGVHLSRMAEDFILWSSSEFGFVRLPDAYTTGSSLMPQKKNPDSLELIRGKSARIQGHLQTLITLQKGLPLTYNRDLQEDKIPVFDAGDNALMCIQVMAGTVDGMTVNPERCQQAVADPLLLATDLADYLVDNGLAFRDAHHAVGRLVGHAEKSGIPIDKIDFAKAKELVPELKEDWVSVFDLQRSLQKRDKIGMSGPIAVKRELERWNKG